MAAARARRQRTTHDGTRRRGRFVARVAALLAGALVAAPLTLVGIASPAAAAEYRSFAPVFTTNTNGDILMAANTLMTCNAALNATTGTCANSRAGTGSSLNNNDLSPMQFVDVDSSASTFNSSTADLTVPDGGSVLWARLYWAGRTGTGGANQSVALRDQAVLRVPGAVAYQPVTADRVDVATSDNSGTAYQAHRDVTAIVQAAGSGTYTVGNVQSSSGSNNQYAGWTLVVAVSDPAAPARNLTIFDGFGSVSSGDPLPTFTVSGFITPPNGDIRTSVGVVAYEGDRGYTGDQLQLNGTNLSDAGNPVGNSFNSSISRFGVDDRRRNPAFVNQLGFDADVFRVGRPVVNNGDTSATITLTTSSDQYFPGVVTFATDLYDPTLLGNKSVTDVNGGQLRPGDVLTYTVPVSNIGLDTAADSRFFDAIPTGTSYVPGSLAVDGVRVTDAQGDDAGYYAAAPSGHVVAYLGASASAGGGGDIPITPALAPAPHTVSFSVRVDDDIPHGAQIVNGAAMTYRGKTTYQSASSVSNVLTDVVTATPVPGANPPIATPHVLTFRPQPTERTLDIAVLDGDRDPDGDTFRVVAVTDAAGAALTVNPDGTVTYAPRDDFAGRDVFTYTIEDSTGLRSTASVQVVVLNDAPVADDDTATTTGGTPVTIDVLDGDTDANGDELSVRSVTPTSAQGGTVTIDPDGSVVYTPRPGFRGTDTFDYVVQDSRGGSDTATVTVTVANGLPVAQPDTYTVNAGGTVALALLVNDSDPDGDAISVAGRSTPSNGSVTVGADGIGTYTPNPGFVGTDTFTYFLRDDQSPAGVSSSVTVTIIVNGAPVATDDTANVPTGSSNVVVPVLDNDTDPENGALTVSVATGPVHGSAAVLPDGTIRYTPYTGWAGDDSFRYRITDAGGLSSTAWVTVTTANTPPVAADDVASVAKNGTLSGVPVLDNDTDVNVAAGVSGQSLRVTAASADNGATVTRNADGTLDVTPAAGFTGTVTVTYTVADGAGGTDVGTLTVEVANGAPSALPDGPVGTSTSTSVLVDVLANDTDPNGDTLTLVPGGLGTPVDGDGTPRGTVTIENGEVRYTPPTGWAGSVTFTYDVTDGDVTATGSATVVVANAVPVAGDFTETTPSGTPVVLDAVGNASDANIPGTDQELTVTGAVADQGAGVVVNTDGTLTLTPAPGFKGDVTVTYTVADGAGGTDTGTITVTVANAAPVADDDSVPTAYGTPVDVDLTALTSDANPDDTLVVSAGTPVDGDGTPRGTVTVTDGVATFTPQDGFSGTVTFPYVVGDGTDTATGTITVEVANAAPVAVADTASTTTSTAVTVDVLGNDTDPNIPVTDQRLQVTGASADNGAGVVVEADGRLTITPAGGFRGDVTVTYTIADGAGGTATGTLVVSVANAAPVAGDDGPVTTASSTSTLIDVLANDTDANPGDVLSVVPASLSVPRDADGVVRGSAAIEGGQVRFTPTPGFAGTVTFTYAVTDGTTADTATVTVVVANDAPVATDDTAGTDTDTAVTVDVLANDTDANIPGSTQELTVTAVTADNGATAVVDPDGRVTVTPAPGFKGDVTVTYTVSDGAGGEDTGTLVVSVANASPVVGDDGPMTTPTDTSVLVDVLDNDTDANGDPLSIVPGALTPPVDGDGTPQGTVTVEDGQVRYVPAPGFAGTVTFEYDVTDGTSTTTGTVTVTVANAEPVAVDDTATTATDAPVTVDVLGNDTDPNIPGTDQRLTVTGATADQGATVAIEPDGRLTVTPATGFKGDVTVTYTVTDGAGGSDEGMLVVTVANAAPVVPPLDTVGTPYGTPVVVDVLTPATDANGDPLEVDEVRVPVDADGTPRGTVTLVDGVVTYTPPAGWSGTVTFEYVVSDGTDTTTGTASVTVGNGAPVVTPDTADGTAGSPVTIDVLGNDSDPEGGPLTIVEVTQPESGTVEIVDGKLVYTPAPGFVGEVTFTYTAADATGARTTTTVTVRVAAAPPVAAGGALAVTGAQVAGLGAAALLLLVGGAVLVTVRRRRGSHVS
ncbi:tandem-95 repeat protein [Cellulomonas sp. Sa3CUA2]|uniref:Tandem-95 repeat protein n=1 Tax=Cellulomonas avistercoris TaxID=2762242 RepID=A0ABR8QIG7_9CELL|nr:Ig-like domain-containing protein [Cellulomonas avistercoris]MBD7920131.1 tandem-95 repeat protein [Cellulomonas avistercoris]